MAQAPPPGRRRSSKSNVWTAGYISTAVKIGKFLPFRLLYAPPRARPVAHLAAVSSSIVYLLRTIRRLLP